MSFVNAFILATTIEANQGRGKRSDYTKTQIFAIPVHRNDPKYFINNLCQTMPDENYSFSKGNQLIPFIDIEPRPMRDLDKDEQNLYDNYIESKKTIIKKSVL